MCFVVLVFLMADWCSIPVCAENRSRRRDFVAMVGHAVELRCQESMKTLRAYAEDWIA